MNSNCRNSIFLWIYLVVTSTSVFPQTSEPTNSGEDDAQIVSYPASFFERYQPSTALEIVNQVPGFILNDGDSERGFGGSVGNVLINDRRPSAKQDPPSQILNRIPASLVERIELIRGQVRNIDLQGFSVVVNVIILEDAEAAARWESAMRYNLSVFPVTWSGGVSVADKWGDIEFNAGVSGRTGSSGDSGTDDEFDPAGTLTESIIESFINKADSGSGNLNASTWFGETFVQLNSELFFEQRDMHRSTHIFPQGPGESQSRETIDGDSNLYRFELGMDAERLLQTDLMGKAIFLFSYQDFERINDELNFNSSNMEVLQKIADEDTETSEIISRLEFDWVRWEDHTLQANFEIAYNVLDNSLAQTEDTGTGPVERAVPGANSKVKEIRGDFEVQDTWTLGAFELELGLGGEVSKISQSGDAVEERDFFFIKPLANLTYSPNQQTQTRVRLFREVAQLDFNDFVSTVVFEDDERALGNPNLRPETTWISEASHERRFGDVGVVTLTAFHHWISDVQDLLPVTEEDEVPGNIGNGRRWGLELESAFPLDWTGLQGSRLDIQTRWQDSSVTDPVTNQTRVLTSSRGYPKPLPFRDELEFIIIAKFRQDFKDAKVSWGIEGRERSSRPIFRVDELEVFNESTEINAFIETTRYWDLKIRLEGQDILDFNQWRNRAFFTGRRDLTPVQSRIRILRHDGARLFLSVSGNF
ncbi:MAG: TonB-dependent receptor [Gammaproteobacteria bacterium]|nr:TonB-dependent receptor [Gammaproteobacteria bacterium]